VTRKQLTNYLQTRISLSPPYPFPTWKDYQKVARETSKIDYNCQFKEGHCKRILNTVEDMNCCVGCASHKGYLVGIPPNSIPSYVRMWNGKTGFWRKGKGCILPRSKRSLTCLEFHCGNDGKYKDDHSFHQIDNQLIRILRPKLIQITLNSK
jgi:hypothetical protein